MYSRKITLAKCDKDLEGPVKKLLERHMGEMLMVTAVAMEWRGKNLRHEGSDSSKIIEWRRKISNILAFSFCLP